MKKPLLGSKKEAGTKKSTATKKVAPKILDNTACGDDDDDDDGDDGADGGDGGGGGGSCFVAGTRIHLYGGGLRPIEDIQVGDSVLSYDGDSRLTEGKVTRLFRHYVKQIVNLKVEDKLIGTTNEHPFRSGGSFMKVSELLPGDALFTLDGQELAQVALQEKQAVEGDATVYNFKVDGTHTYFAEGMAVHNKLRPPDDDDDDDDDDLVTRRNTRNSHKKKGKKLPNGKFAVRDIEGRCVECDPTDPYQSCYNPCINSPDSEACYCYDNPDDPDCSCDESDPMGGCYDPCDVDPDGDDCYCYTYPEDCPNPCSVDPTSAKCQFICNRLAQMGAQSAILQANGSFVVPDALIDALPSGFEVVGLDDATGSTVNSDAFGIHISALPTGMSMDDFLESFRLNINQFTNDSANFYPYNDGTYDYTSQWNESGPDTVGTLVHIAMVNDGTVMISQYLQDQYHATSGNTSSSFTVSTMYSPLDGYHPVSGNRTFGIQTDLVNGGYTFYISGVDRATTPLFNAGAALGGWDNAATLWTTVMNNIISSINDGDLGNTFGSGGTAGGYGSAFVNFSDQLPYIYAMNFLNGTYNITDFKSALGCP